MFLKKIFLTFITSMEGLVTREFSVDQHGWSMPCPVTTCMSDWLSADRYTISVSTVHTYHQVNSAFYPSRVDISSISLSGWGW